MQELNSSFRSLQSNEMLAARGIETSKPSDSEPAMKENENAECRIVPRLGRRKLRREKDESRPDEQKPLVVNVALLKPYFTLPLHEAAKALGLCATALKKVCRKIGIKNWPHRKIKAVDKKLSELKSVQSSTSDKEEDGDRATPAPIPQLDVQSLERNRELLLKGVDVSLGTPPKKPTVRRLSITSAKSSDAITDSMQYSPTSIDEAPLAHFLPSSPGYPHPDIAYLGYHHHHLPAGRPVMWPGALPPPHHARYHTYNMPYEDISCAASLPSARLSAVDFAVAYSCGRAAVAAQRSCTAGAYVRAHTPYLLDEYSLIVPPRAAAAADAYLDCGAGLGYEPPLSQADMDPWVPPLPAVAIDSHGVLAAEAAVEGGGLPHTAEVVLMDCPAAAAAAAAGVGGAGGGSLRAVDPFHDDWSFW